MPGKILTGLKFNERLSNGNTLCAHCGSIVGKMDAHYKQDEYKICMDCFREWDSEQRVKYGRCDKDCRMCAYV